MKKIMIIILSIIFCFITISFAEYSDNGNNTITDTSTCLIWQKHGTYDSYNRSYADQYIDNLNDTGSCKTWRLPNYQEILNFEDYIMNRDDFNEVENYWVNHYSQGLPIGINFHINEGACVVFLQSGQIWAVHNPHPVDQPQTDQNQVITPPVYDDQNQPVQIDQNQPAQIDIDQNQPVQEKSLGSESSGGGGGGGCFIQSIMVIVN